MIYTKKDYTIHLDEVVLNDKEKAAVIAYHQEDIETHGHSFLELAYITGGNAKHTLNGVSESVKKGDYFIVDYGSVHSYSGSRKFTLINYVFLPELIDDTLADCRSVDELLRVCLIRYYKRYFVKSPANRIFQDQDGKILKILLDMQEEYEGKKAGYTEILRGGLMQILILTMRKIMQEERKKQWGENLRLGELQSDAVFLTVQYIRQHYREHAILKKFCEEQHYNQQYISRRFRYEIGLTVREYIQKLRIERSCELLAGSDLSIQEVALESGYEDMQFFHQIFRRMLKMTPREYRKMAGAREGDR